MADTAQFSVEKFSSRIASSGLASPNKFEVVFTNIPGARHSGDDEMQLNLMCDQVSLAGRDVQGILDVWNNKCVNTTGGFHVAYYDDYVGHLDVYVLDRSGKRRTYHMHYHEVYPKTVTAVELNHGTTNATLRVTAEIQYAFWTTNSIHVGSTRKQGDLAKH